MCKIVFIFVNLELWSLISTFVTYQQPTPWYSQSKRPNQLCRHHPQPLPCQNGRTWQWTDVWSLVREPGRTGIKCIAFQLAIKKTCLCWVRPRGKPSIPLQELYYGSTVISKIAFSNKVKNGTLYLVNGNDQSLLTFLHKGFWFGWFVRIDTNTPWCVMFKELYRILWFLNSVGVFASNSIALAQNRTDD